MCEGVSETGNKLMMVVQLANEVKMLTHQSVASKKSKLSQYTMR